MHGSLVSHPWQDVEYHLCKTKEIAITLRKGVGQCAVPRKSCRNLIVWLEARHMLQADANHADCGDGSAAQGADMAKYLYRSHHSRQQAAGAVC